MGLFGLFRQYPPADLKLKSTLCRSCQPARYYSREWYPPARYHQAVTKSTLHGEPCRILSQMTCRSRTWRSWRRWLTTWRALTPRKPQFRFARHTTIWALDPQSLGVLNNNLSCMVEARNSRHLFRTIWTLWRSCISPIILGWTDSRNQSLLGAYPNNFTIIIEQRFRGSSVSLFRDMPTEPSTNTCRSRTWRFMAECAHKFGALL
jgi:hypothetical protein